MPPARNRDPLGKGAERTPRVPLNGASPKARAADHLAASKAPKAPAADRPAARRTRPPATD